MKSGTFLGLWLAGLVLVSGGFNARAQVFERDTKVTGPRGRTIERDVRSVRGPGSIERETRITGPRGRTIERDVRAQRGPGFAERDVTIRRNGQTYGRETVIQRGGGFGPGPVPRFGPGPRNVFIENQYYAPPPPRFAFGFGAAPVSLFFGAPPLFGPPPVILPPPIVVPAPVVVAPPPPIAPPQTVAASLERLKSWHGHSRRDGALTLGRLGDPRAVPALVERLEKDHDKDVRLAAAWALGEIGDPSAALALQKAQLYDKSEVREVAKAASGKLGRARETEALPGPFQTPSGSSGSISSSPATTPLPSVEPGLEPLPDAIPSRPSRSNTPPPPPSPESDLPQALPQGGFSGTS